MLNPAYMVANCKNDASALSGDLKSLQQVRNRPGIMEFRFRQWCSACGIDGMNVRSMGDQDFGNGTLVPMGCSMKRRISIVFVLISRIYIRSKFQKQRSRFSMTFPGGAVEKSGGIAVLH